MPTVYYEGQFRFFFYSRELNEPPHIHVQSGDGYAKFWLYPVSLAIHRGYNMHELNKIGKIIEQRVEFFRRAWDEHFK